MSGERRGVVVTLGAQVMQIGVGVLTSTLIGRALGPEAYGLVNVLRNATMLALTLTPLGLDIALLKYLGAGEAEDPAKAAVVARLRGLAFAASVAAWLAVAFVAGFGGIGRLYPLPQIDALAALAMAALPFATDSAILGAVYRAERRVARFAWLGIGAQSGFRLVAIPLALWLIPSTAIVVAIGAAQTALSSILLWTDRWTRVRPIAPARMDAIPKILSESGWMAMSVFIAALMRSADLLFLGAIAPAREVGAYAAVVMVAQLIAVFPMAASQTLGPRVASAHASGTPGAVQRELNRYLRGAAPVSAFLFGGIVAFGPRLDLIFGARYVFDPVVCFLVAFGQLLSAGLGPMGFALSMTGRHRLENAILSAGAITLALGCALAVPAYGARGAAGCVVGVFLFVNLARFLCVAATHGGAPGHWRDLAAAPIALALALACAAASARWGGRDLASAALGCLAYTGLFAAGSWVVLSTKAPHLVSRGRATS
jgi:O-antigen/teichoic acid export membrane protein